MTASPDARGHLVVTDDSRLIRWLLALCVLGIPAAWIGAPTLERAVGWTAVCGVFGFALTVALERSVFDFDRESRTLRWRRDSPFRHAAGEISFETITALSLERDFRRASPSQGRGGARRLGRQIAFDASG